MSQQFFGRFEPLPHSLHDGLSELLGVPVNDDRSKQIQTGDRVLPIFVQKYALSAVWMDQLWIDDVLSVEHDVFRVLPIFVQKYALRTRVSVDRCCPCHSVKRRRVGACE